MPVAFNIRPINMLPSHILEQLNQSIFIGFFVVIGHIYPSLFFHQPFNYILVNNTVTRKIKLVHRKNVLRIVIFYA